MSIPQNDGLSPRRADWERWYTHSLVRGKARDRKDRHSGPSPVERQAFRDDSEGEVWSAVCAACRQVDGRLVAHGDDPCPSRTLRASQPRSIAPDALDALARLRQTLPE